MEDGCRGGILAICHSPRPWLLTSRWSEYRSNLGKLLDSVASSLDSSPPLEHVDEAKFRPWKEFCLRSAVTKYWTLLPVPDYHWTVVMQLGSERENNRSFSVGHSTARVSWKPPPIVPNSEVHWFEEIADRQAFLEKSIEERKSNMSSSSSADERSRQDIKQE